MLCHFDGELLTQMKAKQALHDKGLHNPLSEEQKVIQHRFYFILGFALSFGLGFAQENGISL